MKADDTHGRATSLAERLSNPMPMMADLDSHMVTQVKQHEPTTDDEDEELKRIDEELRQHEI